QEALVERYFAAGGARARARLEERIRDLVRFATGRAVDVIVYCPARHMQLKEARMHVHWPGEGQVRPLSDFAAPGPRPADLERGYRDLWKFYVFADASEPEVLLEVQRAARAELAGATNAYDVGARG